jgi:hypothetical protein
MLSPLEADTECLVESIREQIPRLETAKKQDRPEMRLQILACLDQFLVKWFPKETQISGGGTETSRDD